MSDKNGNESLDHEVKALDPPNLTAVGSHHKNDEDHHEKQPDDRRDQELTGDPIDVYGYTKRDGQISYELFKIEVNNLPSFASYNSIKKLLKNKFNLEAKKIKILKNATYVTFTSESERDAAVDHLNDYVWKGSKLGARVADPMADPLMTKRLLEQDFDGDQYDGDADESDGKRAKLDDTYPEETREELSIRLNDQVAPFWNMDYDDQLHERKQIIMNLLSEIQREVNKILDQPEVKHKHYDLFRWYLSTKKNENRVVCPITNVIACPEESRYGYRNKCEFSIGSSDKTVGFRLGCYRDGLLQVAPVDDCPFVSSHMKKIVGALQDYVNSHTCLLPFDDVTHKGSLKQFTVRSNRRNESMVLIGLDPQELTPEDLEKEKSQLREFFEQKSDLQIVSLYLHLLSKNSNGKSKLELISGKEVLKEIMTVNDKKLTFSISPEAFFQINTSAAELCYQELSRMVDLNEKTLLLDICCGTGTIGLCLASKVKRVIGIEMSQDAVEDAKRNSRQNNITNATFFSGKAESVVSRIPSIIKKEYPDSDVIAILDPPRAGLRELSFHLHMISLS